MAIKITEKMPKDDDSVYGVWLSNTPNSDTHILLERDSMVIGVNPDYKSQKCTNPALIVGKNRCEIQYQNGDDIEYKELDPIVVGFALRKMLQELKDY